MYTKLSTPIYKEEIWYSLFVIDTLRKYWANMNNSLPLEITLFSVTYMGYTLFQSWCIFRNIAQGRWLQVQKYFKILHNSLPVRLQDVQRYFHCSRQYRLVETVLRRSHPKLSYTKAQTGLLPSLLGFAVLALLCLRALEVKKQKQKLIKLTKVAPQTLPFPAINHYTPKKFDSYTKFIIVFVPSGLLI